MSVARNNLVLKSLLASLAVATVAQAPPLLHSFTVRRAFFQQLAGAGPDPLGLELVAAAAIFADHGLYAVALCLFLVTSALGFVVRTAVRTRVIAVCVALQVSVVAGEYLWLLATRTAAIRIEQFVNAEAAAGPALIAQWAQWTELHDVFVGTLLPRALWILAGFVAALAVSWSTDARETSAVRVPIPDHSVGDPARPHTSSVGSSPFTAGTYAVCARGGALSRLFGSPAEYEITAPGLGKFSFSFSTGTFRREPNGPDVLFLRDGKRTTLPGARSYIVDSATVTRWGSLWLSRDDWEIRDDADVAIGHVRRIRAGHLLVTYVGMMGDREVAQWTWGTEGLTATSASLELTFAKDATAHERMLLIALSPILERQARKASGATVA